MSTMLKMEEAQARALALAPQMQVEQVAAKAAFGRYLAEDLVAQRTQPPADLSAMDGYAVGGDGPWKLVGESRAGAPFQDELKPGEAARISTGAHMAAGSDRVLIQENAEVIGTEIRCFQDMPASGRHVRRKGFDFATGNVVLAAGMQITPGQWRWRSVQVMLNCPFAASRVLPCWIAVMNYRQTPPNAVMTRSPPPTAR